MKTKVKCTKDLFNKGKCFTEGKTYTIDRHIKSEHGLIDATLTNDLSEPHAIGHWWRHFKIVSHEDN